MGKDRLRDMYFSELDDMAGNEYATDKKKIDQNKKVLDALLDILAQDPDTFDYSEQLMTAHINLSRAYEIRAYKMGIATGQALATAIQ